MGVRVPGRGLCGARRVHGVGTAGKFDRDELPSRMQWRGTTRHNRRAATLPWLLLGFQG